MYAHKICSYQPLRAGVRAGARGFPKVESANAADDVLNESPKKSPDDAVGTPKADGSGISGGMPKSNGSGSTSI